MTKKKLSKIQLEHFNKMSRLELIEAIYGFEKDLVFLVFTKAAGDDKRTELELYIKYIQKRLDKLKAG